MEPMVSLIIERTNMDKQKYEVPHFEGMTMLVALRYIHEKLDPTLAFRNYHCGRGVCVTCVVRMDGKKVRACSFPLENLKTYEVTPANDKNIRDLCCEV
jgi:succinate dehydrogenase/fumarate reductase-like Fe-S protein